MAGYRFTFSCCFVLAGSLLVGGLVSCRKGGGSPAARQETISPLLGKNRLKDLPGAVYESQADSSIPWQPFDEETFEAARAANRLLLVVIVTPQQSSFRQLIGDFEQNPSVMKAVKDTYVPVLVDGDQMRELGLLTESLCREIRQPFELPLFVWMSPDGNPVAWIPIPSRSGNSAAGVFHQSHEMVSRMWREDPGYVLKNSAIDNEARQQRLDEMSKAVSPSENPAVDGVAGTRQLLSLYDPVTRSIDEAGGLFPSGTLDLVSASAILPGIPESLRQRSIETVESLMEDLLPSAMFDPLDGGLFAARTRATWALPAFSKNCPDQGRVAAILFRIHQLTGNPAALERALSLIDYSERRCRNDRGLFSFGGFYEGKAEDWTWSVDEVKQALPEEDAKWWVALTGMKEMGNLPSEADPQRRFFRKNTLSLLKSFEAAAAELGTSADSLKQSFERSRKTLLEIREKRAGAPKENGTAHAISNFRMVSAFAAAYAATGDESFRGKAVELLEESRAAFDVGGRLISVVDGERDLPGREARAFIYALAILAAQDVAAIGGQEEPLVWAKDLARRAGEFFLQDGKLLEAPKDEKTLDLPVVDLYRIFDDTSGGLFAIAAARAGEGEGFDDLAAALPKEAAGIPVLYTDRLLASLITHHSRVILTGHGLPAELKAAIGQLPPSLFPVRAAKNSDGIPDGSVRVIASDGTAKMLTDAAELKRELSAGEPSP